jgi:transcriptional regulator NrdR family protein
MINFVVIKKDGTEEEFNIDKILDVIKAAGASEIGAEIIVNKIIESLFKIKSSKIRRLISKFLKKINKKAAKNFKKHYIQEPY